MTDIPRSPAAIRRPPYMIATIALAAIGVPVVSISLLRLRPAGLVVDRSSVWTDTVRRGSMLREVHGSGTLTPEDVRWLAAATEARVDRIVIRPGAAVQADSDIVELTSPEVEQSAVEAGLALRAAEADLASRTVALRSDLLAQRSVAARAREELQEIRLKLAADERLANAGLTSALELQLSHARAEELTSRVAIEDERVTFAQKTLDAQLTALRSRLDQLRSIAALRDKQRDALHVRAGLAGVLQQVAVQVGQRVTAGTPLAKVARPEPLRAELRIAETEARDIQLGQPATIDTHNGIVRGVVRRIDPAAQNGTVLVDIALSETLPKGARPDLGVDGTIQIDRLADVLHVSRPVQSEESSTMSVFRIVPGTNTAVRVTARTGRGSANAIEIVGGLAAGDRIVISDTSSWGSADRVRLK